MINQSGDTSTPNIDSMPLGGKSLGSLLNKSSIDMPAKGLESLISSPSSQELISSKDIERQNKIEQSLAKLSSLPHKIELLDRSLNEILAEKKSSKLKEEIALELEESLESKLKVNNYYKIALMICLSLLMISFGKIFFSSNLPVVAVTPKLEEIQLKSIVTETPQIKEAVTLKFVNLRDKGSSKSNVITMIMPGQTLRLEKEVAGWHRVSWTDKINQETLQGWVYFENIKFLTKGKL